MRSNILGSVRRSLTLLTVTGALLATSLAAAQEAAPAREEIDGLRIADMTLTRAIEGGEPTDATTTFERGAGPVWVVIRLENATGAEADVRVSFERAEGEVAATTEGGRGVTLHVPARRRYRTVARTVVGAPGRYRVVVRTAAGNLLGTADYTIAG
ncbi:MAG: hypothetical protein M3Y87_04220 [Myxococcota bacterium]|nr:hypothetical protein [Myxococcota bacterium]